MDLRKKIGPGVTSEVLDDSAVRAKLKSLLDDRGVIVCKNVEQTPQMQVKLSEVFGPLKEHPVYSVARADRDNLPGVIVIASGPGSLRSNAGKRRTA